MLLLLSHGSFISRGLEACSADMGPRAQAPISTRRALLCGPQHLGPCQQHVTAGSWRRPTAAAAWCWACSPKPRAAAATTTTATSSSSSSSAIRVSHDSDSIGCNECFHRTCRQEHAASKLATLPSTLTPALAAPACTAGAAYDATEVTSWRVLGHTRLHGLQQPQQLDERHTGAIHGSIPRQQRHQR